VSDVVGWLGFVLALCLAIWEIVKYKAEHQEQIAVEFSSFEEVMDPPVSDDEWKSLSVEARNSRIFTGLQVYVTNIGLVPIYLKSVALRTDDVEIRSVENDQLVYRGPGETIFKPWPANDNPLAPSERRRFVAVIHRGRIEQDQGQATRKEAIIVRSTKKELYVDESPRVASQVQRCIALQRKRLQANIPDDPR
jgi:hypothetical protein